MRLISARQAWHDAYHVHGAAAFSEAVKEAQRQIRHQTKGSSKKVALRFPEAYDGAAAEDAADLLVASQVIHACETRSRQRGSSLDRSAHMYTAGKVMHAISTLAPPLQCLGHFLHNSLATAVDQNRAHSYLYFMTDQPAMHRTRKEAAYWIALAAMFSYRGTIRGREEWAPGRVKQMLEELGGIRIDLGHWARDWAELWDLYLQRLDELEALALVPVADLIKRQTDAA